MKGGGGKKKKRGKNTTSTISPFISPTEDQYFARVIKNNGSCRFQLNVFFYTIDEKNQSIKFRMESKLGVVRGKMLRRSYVNAEDIVLVSDREFEKSKVDIIHVYKNYHLSRIQRCKFAPPELINSKSEGGDINFLEELNSDSESDVELDMNYSQKNNINQQKSNNYNNMAEYDDIDLTTSKYSINKFDSNINHANNKSSNYMAGMNLPSFSDEDEDGTEIDNSNIQYDEFGNEI